MGFNPRDAGIFLGMPLIKHTGQCLFMKAFASAKATTVVMLYPKVALYLMAIVKFKFRCSCSQSRVPPCRPWLFSVLWVSLSSLMLLGLASDVQRVWKARLPFGTGHSSLQLRQCPLVCASWHRGEKRMHEDKCARLDSKLDFQTALIMAQIRKKQRKFNKQHSSVL